MERYSIILNKNPREIALLRGSGCKWKKCRFCDYHKDFNKDENENFLLNKDVLKNVTGKFSNLEIINSGSFIDLDENTINLIIDICKEKKITTIHFECHWLDRQHISQLRETFMKVGVNAKMKIGVETFDVEFRENILRKGIEEEEPIKIAELFDECCLLVGIKGQTVKQIDYDIKTALKYFDRVCINLMCENTATLKPDTSVLNEFKEQLADEYINNDRVDLLFDNVDFGVGKNN